MVDFTYYETIAEGDKQFIIQMVQTFIEDIPLMLEVIHQKLEEKDFDALGKAVHKLKPTWSMTGLDVNLLKTIELEIKGDKNLNIIATGMVNISKTAGIALDEMKEKLTQLQLELGSKSIDKSL